MQKREINPTPWLRALPVAAEVTLFTSPMCGPCAELRSLLHGAGIPFAARDVLMDEEAGDRLAQHVIFTTPALQVGEAFHEGIAVDLAALVPVMLLCAYSATQSAYNCKKYCQIYSVLLR